MTTIDTIRDYDVRIIWRILKEIIGFYGTEFGTIR